MSNTKITSTLNVKISGTDTGLFDSFSNIDEAKKWISGDVSDYLEKSLGSQGKIAACIIAVAEEGDLCKIGDTVLKLKNHSSCEHKGFKSRDNAIGWLNKNVEDIRIRSLKDTETIYIMISMADENAELDFETDNRTVIKL